MAKREDDDDNDNDGSGGGGGGGDDDGDAVNNGETVDTPEISPSMYALNTTHNTY